MVTSSLGRRGAGHDGGHVGEGGAGKALFTAPGHVADSGLSQGVRHNRVQKTGVQDDLKTSIDQTADKVLGDN
jgi:hypothetical protein